MRSTMPALLLAAGVFWSVTASTAASTQDFDLEAARASRRVTAVHITEPIVIDGVLDEPAWRLAEPATDFFQQIPDEFAPATERSEVRFLYDQTMLYVGGMLYDDFPDDLVINELRRDFGGFQNDVLTLILDTFRDGRNAYGFMTNVGGAQRDVQASENGRRNDSNWNGVWFVRTQVREDGWSVEIGIPFKTLRFPDRDEQQWGLNLMRIVRRTYEFSTWAPVPRQFSHYSAGYAGLLTGIGAVESGHDLRITPFATAQFTRATSASSGWGGTGDGGVDVKWGITSSMLLDASYRTDFSQVEADEQQINLTRFSLFFPEKRQFFLENSASFQVGLGAVESERRDIVPFFSRRIGLSSAGQPRPVVGGVRFTGRAGRSGIGLLTMQTEAFEGDPGANFTVARLTRDLSETTSVGAFYAGRETAGTASFNRVAGLDLRFSPTRTLELEAFALRSETMGEAGDWAGRTGLRLDTSAHRVRLGLAHIGEAFRHDLGFVRRRGIGSIFGGYERLLRPADPRSILREHGLKADVEAIVDDHYERVLTRTGNLAYQLQFRDSGNLNVTATSTHEHLDEPFTVGANLRIAPGAYSFDTVGADYHSDRSAAVSGGVGVEVGEFWTGRQRITSGSLRVRLNEHVAASADVSRSLIELPEGSLTADLARLRLDLSITPRMFLNAFIQYNGETDGWLSNIRFNLIHRPLSDIYIVWNEARLPTETRRALMFKYTHMVAY